MKNTLYNGEIYNEEIKRDFLSNYGQNTQKTLQRVFKASFASEVDLKKDLCLFNREELRKFLFTLRPSKLNASRQNGTLVSTYIDWAIQKGHKSGLNPLDSLENEWYEQFTDQSYQQYFSESELDYIVQHCQNAQDGSIVELIRNGVLGEACEELLNLRKNDIDFENNTLRLIDDTKKTKRQIQVSEKCIAVCKKALEETEYEKSNGEVSPDTKALSTKLVDNEYIIKSSMTNTKNFEKADKNIIHRRLDVLSKYFDKPNLTPTNLRYSGMLIMAKDLYLKTGKLDNYEYNIIAEQFNVSKLNETEYNLHLYKKEFLNLETLRKM